jgi:transposase
MLNVEMSKTYRPWTPEQNLLLPPSVQDWVEPEHLARFVLSLVLEQLDLGEILKEYKEERGYPPFRPEMMVALLLYSYSQRIYSSRRIAKACTERIDFMVLMGQQKPDFRTISLFRKRHLKKLRGLFGQVLQLCGKAGLVNLGHVALDGTRMQANASKDASISYKEMKRQEKNLRADIDQWFGRSEQTDKEEDRQYGKNRTGEELPSWVSDKKKRMEKIQQAKAELEKEAKAKAEGPKDPGRTRHEAKPTGVPKETERRNLTDPESRMMKTKGGFVQGYNCQAAVDADRQIIVAQHVTNSGADAHELKPLLEQIKQQMRRQARQVSADAGYSSEHNLKELNRRHIRGYVANRWQKDSSQRESKLPTKMAPYARWMWQRLRQGSYRSRYRLRKQTVEPVFGQIKQGRGFRQFLLRGQQNVSGEWSLLCTVHNLMKLAAAAPQ